MKTALFLLLLASFVCASEPAIVFVHLGRKIPEYLPTAIEQARLFNPKSRIFLIANQAALQLPSRGKKWEGVECIYKESLPRESVHEEFSSKARMNRTFRGEFWTYAMERFFYLYELMKSQGLTDVFHLENDVMLYRDLKEILPLFTAYYPEKIAATFDNDDRCIAGFMYVAKADALYPLLELMSKKVAAGGNDMFFLGQFRNDFGKAYIDHLPIVCPEYAKEYPLMSTSGLSTGRPEDYFCHAEEFVSLFDAAAIGQYLGGIDPQHNRPGGGFINESCLFDVSRFQLTWEKDAEGRLIPYALFQSSKWRINNLHINSKNLEEFYSKK